VIIKLEHGGKSYAYDDESLTVLQGIAVEEHIKGTLVDFDQGLGSQRAVCFQALGWLIFHDADPKVPIAEVDFPLIKLSTAWLQARLTLIEQLNAAIGAEPDAAPAKAARPVHAVARTDESAGSLSSEIWKRMVAASHANISATKAAT